MHYCQSVNYVKYFSCNVTRSGADGGSFVKQKNSFQNTEIMSNILYIVAVILIILWAVGYMGFNAGALIHILLVIALIAILLRLIQGRKAL
jgi:hypothetical protein